MIRRDTLPRKIVSIGLLNLALLAAVLLGFARLQFGVGPEALLAGVARGRIMDVANAFRLELDTSADKAAVIARYARRLEAEVFVADPDGVALHGPSVAVPEEVMRRFRLGPRRSPPPPPPPQPRAGGESRPMPKGGRPPEPFFLVSTANPTLYWAVVRLPVLGGDGFSQPAMIIFRSPSIFNQNLFFHWLPWALLALALLVVSLICWLPFLGELTRSIRRMDEVTKEIANGRFDSRVQASRRDELGDLGEQINTMAARLESFVSSQKRFLGDVAHELSAPLARIQFALGILERRVEEARRDDIEVLRDEIQEMSVLVNELLSFSKASLAPGAGPLEQVRVGEVVRRAAERESLTPDVRVDAELAAFARPGQLTRAIGNLLRNAARYAGDCGPIEVTARREGQEVVISVADHGPGLPDSALEQIFEPFWRPHVSRARDTGGVGLGLAIVKSCVESCSGTVSCRNRKPAGLEVLIRLPAVLASQE